MIFKYQWVVGLYLTNPFGNQSGFDENFYQDDYDFWLKLKKKIKIGYIDTANYFL